MCFIIQHSNRDQLIAEKDIICHKYLLEDLRAPFVKDFKYELGKLYELERPMERDGDNCINEGFHSYYVEKLPPPFSISPHEIHVKVECTIPKGAAYYKNDYYLEYVSDKIIINKIIE